METLVVVLVGLVLGAAMHRGATPPAPPAGRPPEDDVPHRRRPEAGHLHQRRLEERESATHARRLAWLAENRDRAAAAGDEKESRRFAAMLSAEESRHAETLRKAGCAEK